MSARALPRPRRRGHDGPVVPRRARIIRGAEEVCAFIERRIGADRASEIISHVYPLERDAAQEAWSLFSEHRTDKVVFTP